MRNDLGLAFGELKRCSLADLRILILFRLRRLVDCEKADVAQNRFRLKIFVAAASRDVMRKDHVDAVVRKDESARAGVCADRNRDGAHSRRHGRCEEARGVRVHGVRVGDRFTRDERRAHDNAGDRFCDFGLRIFGDEAARDRRLRPRFPADGSRVEGLTRRHFLGGNEDVRRDRRWRQRSLNCSRAAAEHAAHQQRSCARGDRRDGENRNACYIHGWRSFMKRRGAWNDLEFD